MGFLMYTKMKNMFIFGCFILVSTIILSACNKSNKGGAEINSESKLSVEQKYDQAEERNDIEILQEKMPWLDITSAKWKQIILSDYIEAAPGPTDLGTTGILTLDRGYLSEIKEKYKWYDSGRSIPNSFLTDEMEGYVLYASQEYKDSYMPFFKGKNLVFFIDFEKEIVMFSY